MSDLLDLRIKEKPQTTCDEFEVVEIVNGENFKRQLHKIPKCDYFLTPAVYKGRKFIIVDKFEDLAHNRGFGLIIKKDKQKVFDVLKNVDWHSYVAVSFDGLNALQKSDIIRAWNENRY